jgi:hypothetical protein
MLNPRLFLPLILLALLLNSARADVAADARAISGGSADRTAAAIGAGESLRALESQVRAATLGTDARIFTQQYLITIPVVEQCAARASSGEEIPLAPLMPMGGQPPSIGTTAARQFDLVYGAGGTLEDLKGKAIANSLVILDIDTPEAISWQRAASLGAAGVVFLGDSRSASHDFLARSTTVPLGLPRFYCDDPRAVEWLKGAGEPGRSLTLRLAARWEERTAENLICFLPPKGPAEWSRQWLILQTRYDASSQVIGRAPGATSAINAALLVELARQVAAAPRHCGVVLAWTSGDEWNLRGTREFLDLIQRGGRAGQAVQLLQEKSNAVRRQADDAILILREAQSVAQTGWPQDRAQVPHAAPIIEEELLRQSNQIENQLQRLQRRAAAKTPEAAALSAAKQSLLIATNLVSGSDRTSTAEVRRQINLAAETVARRWEADLRRLEQEHEALAPWPAIRAALPGAAPDAGPIDPLLFLSIAWTGGKGREADAGRLGLLTRSFYSAGLDASSSMSEFLNVFQRYGALAGKGFEPASLYNSQPLESLLPLKLAFSSDAAIARGLPAAAFATLLDPATRLGTPNDTFDQLDLRQLEAQQQTLFRFLLGNEREPGLLTEKPFYVRAQVPPLASDQWITLYQEGAGPRLPRSPHALVGGESEIFSQPLGEPLLGTRRDEWLLTRADGTALFHSLPRAQGAELRLQAFEFDDAGNPLKALSASPNQSGMLASFFPSDTPRKALLFDCQRLDLYDLFDPRYMDLLEKVQILDARRMDDARHLSVFARRGIAAVFMPPAQDIHWQLLASRGNVNNRMIVLNATAENPSGTGFQSTSLAPLGSLRWGAAQDFLTLDHTRKTRLETFGISNEIIRGLHADSEASFAAARDAQARMDYPAFAAAADALLAMQSQEYQALISTSNGIVHGVIFLLLGLIPFSYFLERLLVGSPSVYRQIAWFTGIFVFMTLGLLFHPAFRISNSPLMILLAFFILILSGTVVYILWGKFEEEIRRLRGTAGEAQHVQSFRRGAVLGAAFRLGLSNMRRRAMRTTLTLITLVLLTFTLLCFTSVRESLRVSPHPVDYFQSHAAPPPGIFLRRMSEAGWDDLPPETLQLARGFALGGEGPPLIAPRYWHASRRAEQPWQLPVQSGDDTYFVSGLLGLSPEEAQFQPASPITADLAPDACWLPEKAREKLQLAPGATVWVLGFPLKLAGYFSQEEFSRLRCLTGDPLSPVDPVNQKGVSFGTGAAIEQARHRFLSPISTAIVPADITRRLDARLTSIMLRPALGPGSSAETLETLAADLARRSASTIYVSSGTRVLAINASEATRPQDLSTVLVPIVIAGIIVLNTMLGAVSERTREIHVYTSVGLSPTHVGMLFLAEAAALGTLGVVFGYIFGQALATFLSWTHLLPGVDLNYSSMAAIFTMGLVLGIVMLSALWPAYAASRLAVPSLQRDWKLPAPVGDLLLVDLPFTVNESAARGTLAFIAEFLTATSSAGTGRFTADHLSTSAAPETQGIKRTLSARIWLAPFDLGVIQMMQLSIHPTDQPNVFDVHVQLTREAGNPATWRRLNRPFLTEIRRQFLLWRALDSQRVARYVETAATLFGEEKVKSIKE